MEKDIVEFLQKQKNKIFALMSEQVHKLNAVRPHQYAYMCKNNSKNENN